jgi:Co/Zn/Cd efflux system component
MHSSTSTSTSRSRAGVARIDTQNYVALWLLVIAMYVGNQHMLARAELIPQILHVVVVAVVAVVVTGVAVLMLNDKSIIN